MLLMWLATTSSGPYGGTFSSPSTRHVLKRLRTVRMATRTER